MDEGTVREQVIRVLTSIQSDSGYGSDPISGSTCPAKDLRGFDSKIWPAATTILAQETGIEIPKRAKLFVSADGKQRLSVDQITAELCRFASATQAAASSARD